MATIFEEITALDRPFIPVLVNFNGKAFEWKARRPNSLETDAIDAYYSDEYAKLIVKYTDKREDGKPNELEQMRTILRSVTIENLITQLMQTRRQDVDRAALTKIDFSPQQAAAEATLMEDEEKAEFIKTCKAQFEEAHKAAELEIRAEYEHLVKDELVETLSQVNLNMKCLMEAGVARQAMFIFFTLHDEKEEPERICPSVEDVRAQFQQTTINYLFENINAAFSLAVRTDLPFVSPVESTLSGPPTSANTSEPATTPSNPGGKRTRRRRKNSKPSSSPRVGTPPKKD